MKGIHHCSYCGASYKGSDDKLVDGGWARFEISIGKGECMDFKSRTSCPLVECRQMMHRDMMETFGGRIRAKVEKSTEEMM